MATILTVHAQDNAAQAAARQALAAKLFEIDAANPTPTNSPAPAPAAATKVKPAPAPKPAVAPKASIDDVPPATTVSPNEPVMTPVGGTNSQADAKAQKAAAKKAAAIKAREDAAAKAQADADAKAKKLADKEAAKKHDAEVAAAEKQAKLNTDAAMKPPQQPVAVTLPEMAAPPAPINTTKQQQLTDLLNKYRADQITPEEYQKQRADIMAQP